MALPATVHRFKIHLSDADRGVYEELEIVAARHPSETEPFFAVRVLAWAVSWEPGIAFSKGVSDTDEPAISIRALDGELTAWIEVGLPAADRLHRASKKTDRVVVFPHRDTKTWRAICANERIHRANAIRIVEFEPDFITRVVKSLERNVKWGLTVTDGTLYLEAGGQSLSSAMTTTPLASE